MKRLMLLSFLAIGFATTTSIVMAHSTIYVDEIGRLHFLGKDPGSKANYAQEIGNFDNPEQKELTNIIYKNPNQTTKEEQPVNNELNRKNDTDNSAKGNKSKSTYTYKKGSIDPSNPYSYGNTNIDAGVNESKSIYTDEIGRQHFLGKDNIKKY